VRPDPLLQSGGATHLVALRASPFVTLAAILWLVANPQLAAAATLSGVVTDASAPSAPVEEAVILLRGASDHGVSRTVTDATGRFTFDGVAPGSYTVVATRLGYERGVVRRIALSDSAPATIAIALSPAALRLNPVVVSPSRRPEKMLDAPSPTSVVGRRAIEERVTRSPSEHFTSIPGMHAATSSLSRTTVVMRGFGGMIPRDLHTLVDYRIASLPSPRLTDFWYIPAADEDLERIELVRGPGAALYGPNADRGVTHFITRSPLDSKGTILRVGGGERDILTGALSHTQRLGQTWAYRISAQYFRGRDWLYVDPVEAARRAAAIAGGAIPSTLLIGAREPIAERVTIDARADWRPRPTTTVVFAGGGGDLIHSLGLSDVGALQVEHWTQAYGQVRAASGSLFAQSYVNVNDSGDTYFLRTGAPIINKSRLYVAQVQNGTSVGSRERLTYGLDAQQTDPRTEGTIHGRNEGDDRVNELGGYIHSETRLTSRLRGLAALRVDSNDRLETPVLSPRAAFVFQPAERHHLRIAYNRAFGTPDASDFFADLVLDSLPLPMAVRTVGVPETGFTFRRQNGQPYMRSPFTPPSAGGPFAFLPPDATLLWPAVVAIAQAQGADLSSIPPPTATEVSSSILAQDPATGSLSRAGTVRDIPRLKPTITNSVEVGYQGWLGGRVRFEASAYRTWIEDFISRFRLVTPNVFLDEATLAAYLAGYMNPAQAAAIAAQLSHIPLGTITPEQARDPADILLASQNFGLVQLWGADGGFAIQVAEPWSVSGTFTWISRDLFPKRDGLQDIALNAPRLSGSLALQYRDPGLLYTAIVRLRASDSYPFQSGVYSGEIRAYGLLDVALTWKPQLFQGASLLFTADNVLNDRHPEFIGAADIGRAALLQVRREF
jgi:outer membrane receptor for ferrienterochelin and colicins